MSQLTSDQCVQAVYRALLGRDADASGLKHYGRIIEEEGDLAKVIATVIKSAEYVRRGGLNGEAPAHPLTVMLHRLATMLARRAGPKEVDQALKTVRLTDPLGVTLRRLLAEIPRTSTSQPRVLLFGAYGNGNLGDAYQALAVRAHLMSGWGLPSESIFACSVVASDDYPFPPGQKVPGQRILDHAFLGGFDCLVIGGGGLLAHPHDPLRDADWAANLRVPVALLAVGAHRPGAEASRGLVRDAALVSGRDRASLAGLSSIGMEPVLAPDPILALEDASRLSEFDRTAPGSGAKHASTGDAPILWVVKYPSNETDRVMLAKAAQLASARLGGRHRFVAVEPRMDGVLKDLLAPHSVELMTQVSDLAAAIEQSRMVLSMRYHGAIFALLGNKPVYGMSQIKIATLFEEYGFAGSYLTTPDALVEAIKSADLGQVDHSKALASARRAFQRVLTGPLRSLVR